MTRPKQSPKLVHTMQPTTSSAAARRKPPLPQMDEVVAHPARKWELDLKVPVATILVLFLQAFGAIWWASGVQAQVDHNTQAIAAMGNIGERFAHIEEQSEQNGQALDRIENRLDRMRD